MKTPFFRAASACLLAVALAGCASHAASNNQPTVLPAPRRPARFQSGDDHDLPAGLPLWHGHPSDGRPQRSDLVTPHRASVFTTRLLPGEYHFTVEDDRAGDLKASAGQHYYFQMIIVPSGFSATGRLGIVSPQQGEDESAHLPPIDKDDIENPASGERGVTAAPALATVRPSPRSGESESAAELFLHEPASAFEIEQIQTCGLVHGSMTPAVPFHGIAHPRVTQGVADQRLLAMVQPWSIGAGVAPWHGVPALCARCTRAGFRWPGKSLLIGGSGNKWRRSRPFRCAERKRVLRRCLQEDFGNGHELEQPIFCSQHRPVEQSARGSSVSVHERVLVGQPEMQQDGSDHRMQKASWCFPVRDGGLIRKSTKRVQSPG